jgi:hypothetical protein
MLLERFVGVVATELLLERVVRDVFRAEDTYLPKRPITDQARGGACVGRRRRRRRLHHVVDALGTSQSKRSP